MMKRRLKSLSMDKYARFLSLLFPGSAVVALTDADGVTLWRPAASARDDAQPADSLSQTRDPGWLEIGEGIEKCTDDAGYLLFRAPLIGEGGSTAGWLQVTYDRRVSVPMDAASDRVQQSLSDACALVQHELDLQAECDQLADELTDRYEELNLVYATKDEVEYVEEGREALVQLVHNCSDYLDVQLAVMISRDRDLVLCNGDRMAELDDIDGLMALLSGSVYDYVESQVSSVVINEADYGLRANLLAGRREHLLAQPIIDDHGVVIGLVAVVASGDRRIFSNGDRNLLEVMTQKASRIIHIHHDSLTGLLNRSGFEPSLVTALAAARNHKRQHCLLHVDIDKLHVINDLLGHEQGDQLIRRVSKALRGLLRDSDLLARLTGDEFAVLLSNCNAAEGHAIAEKLQAAIRQLPVISGNQQLDVSASIGIVQIDGRTDGIVGVMASAEIACKTAKDAGRDRIQVYDIDNKVLIQRSSEIEWLSRVQRALREDRFALHCQPVAPLADPGKAPHFEVLVRMLDDDDNILSPADFMPAAERFQMMPQLDRWVVRQTLKRLASCWADLVDTKAVFCINLSGQSLTNAGFFNFVRDELAHSGIPAPRICFEITETAAIANIDEAVAFMGALRDIGCRFALDDFGAGLSSFAYLKTLPVDYLKIDGSFIREITRDEFSRSMVEAICQIAGTMNLTTIAEFVGDEATVDALRDIGLAYVQGYHIGKPVPLDVITAQLQRGAASASA